MASWLSDYLDQNGFEEARAQIRAEMQPIEDRPSNSDLITGITDAMNAALGGTLESGSMAGGALAGGKAAAMATRNPWATLAGALAGGAYGGYIGRRGRQDIASATGYLRSPSEVPEDRRAWANLGETIGMGLPIVAAPYIAAGQGVNLPRLTAVARPPLPEGASLAARAKDILAGVPSRAANAVGNIPATAIDAARRAPLTTAASELGMLGMAGTGAYAAEQADPGNETLRTLSEIGFGAVNPAAITRPVVQNVRSVVSKAGTALSDTYAREQAGARLRQGIETLGGDPDAVARKLGEAEPGLPTAMATDDPYLRLETGLAAKRKPEIRRKLDDVGKAKNDETLDALRALSGATPDVLRERAAQRMNEFSARLTDSWETAKKAANVPITLDEPRMKTAISEDAQHIVRDSLRSARGVENDYWENLRALSKGRATALLPEDQPGLLSAYRNEIGKLLPKGDALPEIITGNVNVFAELSKDKGGVALDELIKFRGTMLKRARQTVDPNEAKYASAFRNLANAADTEIKAAVESSNDNALRAALDDANGFTAALHDTFTRTFAGDALQRATTGEERITPETMLNRAFGGGRELGETQFKELRGVTEFLPSQGLGDPQAVTRMRDLQERYLRLTAAEKRTPDGEAINVNALKKWMKTNQGALDEFPAMRADFEKAMQAQNRFSALSRHYRKWTTPGARKGVFSDLVRKEDPVSVLETAANSKIPKQAIGGLARIAKRSGPAATEGLAATAIEYEIRQAMRPNGGVDYGVLNQRISQSPVLEILRKAGVLNDTQLASAKLLAQQGGNIEAALSRHGIVDILGAGEPQRLEDFATRVAGAQLGNVVAPGGSNLIVSAAGSKLLRDASQKTPQKRMESILEQAALDKDFAADLLRLTKSKTPTQAQIGRIRAYLWQTGILTSDTEEGTVESPTSP